MGASASRLSGTQSGNRFVRIAKGSPDAGTRMSMEVPPCPARHEVCDRTDYVTGISDEGRAENQIDLPVLALHLQCVFAAGEDHAPHGFRSTASSATHRRPPH